MKDGYIFITMILVLISLVVFLGIVASRQESRIRELEGQLPTKTKHLKVQHE